MDVGENSSITRVNAKLQAFEEWTAKSIDWRQELLMDLAKDIWRVSAYGG